MRGTVIALVTGTLYLLLIAALVGHLELDPAPRVLTAELGEPSILTIETANSAAVAPEASGGNER